MFPLTDFLVVNIFKDKYKLQELQSENYDAQWYTMGVDGKYVKCIKPGVRMYSEDFFEERNIMICKIGKYLKFAYDKLTPAQITKISEKYRSLVEEPRPFKIIENDDIKWAYWTKNYFNHIGTLSNSCMRYIKCQRRNYFQIYADNAKMLVMTPKRGKRIIGRAILWPYKDTYLMDRVYTTENYVTEQFFSYAKSQGFGILCQNLFVRPPFSQGWLLPDDDYKTPRDLDIKISLNKEYDAYPFLDSFCYLSFDRQTLSSTPFKGKQYVLHSVCGGKIYYEFKNND